MDTANNNNDNPEKKFNFLEKKCIRCGVLFTTKRPAAKYCSCRCSSFSRILVTECVVCKKSREELLAEGKIKQGFSGKMCEPCYNKSRYIYKPLSEKKQLLRRCIVPITGRLRYHIDKTYKQNTINNAKARYWNNREAQLAYMKAWRKANPEKKKLAYRKCVRESGDKYREYQRKKYHERRKIVLNAYGHKCACCGEHRKEFLTIEHLHKNGSVHRKKENNIYQFLIKNNFPKDSFALYCFNCNMAEGRDRICPHKTERGISDLGILELQKIVA